MLELDELLLYSSRNRQAIYLPSMTTGLFTHTVSLLYNNLTLPTTLVPNIQTLAGSAILSKNNNIKKQSSVLAYPYITFVESSFT